MRDEYDFTHAEQGKFYVPIEEIQIPIYLDKDVESFLAKNLDTKSTIATVVNELLRKDIEIAKKVMA